MRHRVKKIKFKRGKDSAKMLVRKLVVNFISNAKIETTLKKVKILKSLIEKLVEKTKIENEANKNYLTAMLGDKKLVDMSFKNLGPQLKGRKGGYVKIVKLGRRDSDGAEMGRLEWVGEIVVDKSRLTASLGSKKIPKPTPNF